MELVASPLAISELHRQLISPKTVQSFVGGSVINLFRLFDQTGLSCKGQITSGFGERGLKASLKASVNFGDLVLPGLFSAKIQGDADLAVSSHTLLVVARQPAHLTFAFRNWKSCVPMCLAVLSGNSVEGNLTFGASTSVGRWSDVDELGLKLSAAANASIGGQLLDLSDVCPRHYPTSASDGSLARDFALTLDALTRHQVKNMVAAWLKSKEKTSSLTDKLKKLIGDELDLEALEKRKEETVEWARKKLPYSDKLEKVAETGVFGRIGRWLNPPKSEGLLERLDTLDKLLKEVQDATPARIIGSSTDAADENAREQTRVTRQQVALFRAQIKSLQARKLMGPGDDDPQATTRHGPPIPSRLCHLHVFVQRRGGSVEVASKLGLQLLQAGVKADANASYTRSARLVSYRFQQLASGTTPMVITQDTALVLREVDAKAAASFKAGIKLPNADDERTREGQGEKALLYYRTMTCRSAVVYWQPPPGTSAKTIVPGSGSGVSFGFGVQATRLVQVAREADWRVSGKSAEISEESTALIAKVAQQLRVSPERIEQFLVAAKIGGDNPDGYVSEVVWLEAGFALPQLEKSSDGTLKPLRLPIAFLGGTYRLADSLSAASLGGAMDSAETLAAKGLVLNVVRLRYRLSDGRDRTQTAFKLGFSYVLGFKLAVDKLRTAGHEGVVDLFTWFADDDYNNLGKSTEGYERAVPPVAFLHQ